MTYINALEERNAFLALRSWLVNKGFTLRQLFWMTGLLAFFISPVADNLTTALLMGAVVMAVGANTPPSWSSRASTSSSPPTPAAPSRPLATLPP
jgi:Na+/H+ antiporter NhaD/arsenite permease-like protein